MKKLLLVVFVFAAAVGVAQETDTELFQQAERRFESQDFELALDRYAALVREHPVSQYVPDAQYRIAVSLYRLGRYEEALAGLQRVARRFQSTRFIALVPFWTGVSHYQLGQYDAAVQSLSAFVQGRSENGFRSQALLYLGLAHVSLDEQTAAVAALEQLLREATSEDDTSYALALLLGLYVDQERYADAIDRYTETDPGTIDQQWMDRIVFYVAESYAGTGESTVAAQFYRRLEGADPEIASVAFQRLFAYAQSGVIEDAPQDVLNRAERALSGRTDILQQFWLSVGVESYQQGRTDLAELYFRRIWDFRQSTDVSAIVPLYLARLLEQRDQPEDAVAVLAEFVARSDAETEHYERVLLSLGNLQLRLGNATDAAQTLQRFVNSFRDSEYAEEAVYQLAFALRSAGRQSEALDIIERQYAAGRIAAGNTRILRLKARMESELGRSEASLQTLYEYLPLAPQDVAARLDYLKLLFALDRFDRVVDAGRQMLGEFPTLQDDNPSAYLQVRYVVGLSYVSLQRYELAIREFSAMDATVQSPVVEQIAPYALYYASWSQYRLGAYEQALAGFGRLVESFGDHQLAAQSAYLGGWSAFRTNQFENAGQLLQSAIAYDAGEARTVEASFLLGRVYAAQNRDEAAAVQFRTVYLDHAGSEYADDAWFEYAEAMVRLGRVGDAVSALAELVETYPASNLTEDAMYRKAELLFGEDRFREAQEGFFAYRTAFPEGRFVDGALYWGGRARAELDEGAGALLLWERIIEEFRTSPFRADAMNQAAAMYKTRGEYREALNLLSAMTAAYPEAASAADARRRSDELVLLITGLSDREAQLMVTIEDSGRASTSEGRRAIIELGRIAIYEPTSAEVDPSTVVPMLNDVAELADEQPAQAAQALFLLAEYYSALENYLQAGNTFLDVAATDPSNGDLAAYALLRAAQAYSAIGMTEEVRVLVDRLEESFPRSEWITEARRLLPEEQE